MRHKMKGPLVSNAATYVRRQLPTAEEFDALYNYEYLDEVPQPYREMFQQVIDWQMNGGKEQDMDATPMPSYRQTATELGELYRSSAEAKGVSVRQLAIKAKVRPALVIDFYAGRTIPIPALAKIKRALADFGIVFGV